MRFYNLSYDEKYRNVGYARTVDWESIKCPKYSGHQRAGKRIGNLKVEIKSNRYGDFLWTFLSDLLLKDRAVDVLKENNVKGFTLRPVEIVNKKTDYTLSELVITGWAGLSPSKSGIRLKKRCKYCNSRTYTGIKRIQYLIDSKKWDGSDIFMIWPMPRFVFITEKVVELIKQFNLNGCEIIPIEKLTENRHFEGFSPGRLSFWMPDNRARELGVPLDIY